jgi:hypothetical protein
MRSRTWVRGLCIAGIGTVAIGTIASGIGLIDLLVRPDVIGAVGTLSLLGITGLILLPILTLTLGALEWRSLGEGEAPGPLVSIIGCVVARKAEARSARTGGAVAVDEPLDAEGTGAGVVAVVRGGEVGSGSMVGRPARRDRAAAAGLVVLGDELMKSVMVDLEAGAPHDRVIAQASAEDELSLGVAAALDLAGARAGSRAGLRAVEAESVGRVMTHGRSRRGIGVRREGVEPDAEVGVAVTTA